MLEGRITHRFAFVLWMNRAIKKAFLNICTTSEQSLAGGSKIVERQLSVSK